MTAARERGRSFWNRDFLLALAGYFFLFMAVSLFFLFPVVLEKFGPRQSRIGLIMGVFSVVAIAVRPFFGRMIDVRGGRRFALLGVCLLIFAVPFFHFVDDAGWLPFLLRALTGLGWGISMTATIAMCSDLAPVDRLAKSMGVIGVAGLVANALGPLLAEELIRAGGAGRLYNASLLFLAAALACLLLTREIAKPDCGVPPGGARALKLVPWALAAVVASVPVFHGAIRGAMIYFIAVFGNSVGISRVGPFFLVFSLAAILTRFRLGDLSDRIGRKTVILPAALIIGLQSVRHRPGPRPPSAPRRRVRRRAGPGADLPGPQHVHHRFPGAGEQGAGHQPVQLALRRRHGPGRARVRLDLGPGRIPVDVPHRRALPAGLDGRVHGEGAGDRGPAGLIKTGSNLYFFNLFCEYQDKVIKV